MKEFPPQFPSIDYSFSSEKVRDVFLNWSEYFVTFFNNWYENVGGRLSIGEVTLADKLENELTYLKHEISEWGLTDTECDEVIVSSYDFVSNLTKYYLTFWGYEGENHLDTLSYVDSKVFERLNSDNTLKNKTPRYPFTNQDTLKLFEYLHRNFKPENKVKYSYIFDYLKSQDDTINEREFFTFVNNLTGLNMTLRSQSTATNSKRTQLVKDLARRFKEDQSN